jgi:hypothetical protein
MFSIHKRCPRLLHNLGVIRISGWTMIDQSDGSDSSIAKVADSSRVRRELGAWNET